MYIKYEWNVTNIGNELVFDRCPEEGVTIGTIGKDYYNNEYIKVKPVFDEDRFMIGRQEQVVGIGTSSKGDHVVTINIKHGQYSIYRKSKGGWVLAKSTHHH